MEAQGCRRIGFDDSAQLMYRRGGFVVLVKRVARYEVVDRGTTTAMTVASPVTLFPRGLLHTSTVAHLMLEKFGLGVPHYRLERELAAGRAARSQDNEGRYMEQAIPLSATVMHAM